MGAHSYCYYIEATTYQDFKREYDRLVEEDRYENGSGAYSGTLQQKPGIHLMCHDPIPEHRVNQLIEASQGDSKWSDFSKAAPVCKMKPFGKAKTFNKVFEVQVGGYHDESRVKPVLIRMAREQLGDWDFEIVGDVTVVKKSDHKFKVHKNTDEDGWTVLSGGSSFKCASLTEATKKAKEVSKDKGQATVCKIAGKWIREQVAYPKYQISFKYKKTKPVDEISHYAVWGWAAN